LLALPLPKEIDLNLLSMSEMDKKMGKQLLHHFITETTSLQGENSIGGFFVLKPNSL